MNITPHVSMHITTYIITLITTHITTHITINSTLCIKHFYNIYLVYKLGYHNLFVCTQQHQSNFLCRPVFV